jgi:uncharacterized LabA/DUF88 family protein
MPTEPAVKRTIAFIDGQNLFHNVRHAFGYTYPNYDVVKLSQAVCSSRGWQLSRVQFYTGIPSAADNAFWHGFWTKKLAAMGRKPGVKVYSRSLVYRNKTVNVPGFGPFTFPSGEEKGIDVRLALDVLDAAHANEFDIALIFSQDQDLSELASLISLLVASQNRWIKNSTDWCPIDRATYDGCIDTRDYR